LSGIEATYDEGLMADSSSLTGQTISDNRIVAKLGGCMGVVYKGVTVFPHSVRSAMD
jgi:hypothetical protein